MHKSRLAAGLVRLQSEGRRSHSALALVFSVISLRPEQRQEEPS